MRCVECGHEIKDGAVFCIRCGAMQVSNKNAQGQQVHPAGGAPAGTPRNVKTFEPTPKRGGSGIVVFVIAAIAVLAAIVALAMFALNPGSSGGSSSSNAATTKNATLSSASSSSASSSASSSSASSKSGSSASASSAASSASASRAAAATTGAGNANAASDEQQGDDGNGNADGNGNGAATTGQEGATQQAATDQQQGYQGQQAQPQQQYEEPEPAPAPEPEQAQDNGGTDGSYMLGDTSDRLYSREELESMSSYDLWIARNEIFARHGRGFSDPDLQAYFDSKSWYTRQYSPAEWDATQSVSSIESQNAALMLQIEQERHSEYL